MGWRFRSLCRHAAFDRKRGRRSAFDRKCSRPALNGYPTFDWKCGCATFHRLPASQPVSFRWDPKSFCLRGFATKLFLLRFE